MKKTTCFFVLWLCFAYMVSNAQTHLTQLISFKVAGACEGQCKPRIEAAAKLKGVQSAVWDAGTGMLSLVYDANRVSLDKIRHRIVAAGHDVDTMKAEDAVYNALPACCHYREIAEALAKAAADTTTAAVITGSKVATDTVTALPVAAIDKNFARGLVLEANRKGVFVPLSGASIVWLGTKNGTTTDSGGVFSLLQPAGYSKLVVSYAGYLPDTLTVTDKQEIRIILATGKKLAEVVVSSRQRSSYLSAVSPVRTQVMTERELFKAACCNLSESFETNPSVDVSYNDAVTGSKQIQLLGLSGNYTQLTVENLPGPRGIATPLGLNSIAGPWVESIQLTKGIGSVANGYESIAG